MPAVAAMTVPATQRLIEVARQRGVLTYAALAVDLGTVSRVVPQVLKEVQGHCLRQDLPDLSALVVRKASGRPGGGFFAPYGLEDAAAERQRALWTAVREAAYAHAW